MQNCRNVKRVALSYCALIGLTLFVRPALGIEYAFTKIADTAGPYAQFHSPSAWPPIGAPAINNAGSVLFRARLDNGSVGIFSGPDPTVHVVASDAGAFGDFPSINSWTGGAPALNDSGAVAFDAALDGHQEWGIYRGPNPAVHAVVTNQGPFNAIDPPTLNNAGSITFDAQLDSGVRGIYRGPDPTADAIVTDAGPYLYFQYPKFNDVGTLAFSAATDDFAAKGIYTGPNPTTDGFVTNAGPFDSFWEFDINNSGRIAFLAWQDPWVSNVSGIYTGPDPIADAVATTAGPFKSFEHTEGPGINNAGMIAFYAELDSGFAGIYTGPDPEKDKIIQITDELFEGEARVQSITFLGPTGLNDAGQVVFQYTLSNGREGIAVATPIPEPASLALVVFAMGAATGRRRRGDGDLFDRGRRTSGCGR